MSAACSFIDSGPFPLSTSVALGQAPFFCPFIFLFWLFSVSFMAFVVKSFAVRLQRVEKGENFLLL